MSFQDKLKENQMKHAETALLQTIFQDPAQTIGDIWESLEADPESEAMWELFKNIPIGKLVTAAASFVTAAKVEPSASASKKAKPQPKQKEEEDVEDEEEDDDDAEFDDEDDEFEDEDDDEDEEDDEEEEEDEDDDDDEEEDEDDEEEEERKKPKSKKKGKGKASSSKKSKSKSEPESLDLSSPDAQKAYRHAIVKCLKASKARDQETAMRSTLIREQIGGDSKQFRDHINELIEAKRVAFSGKARGTKYWLDA